MKRFIFIFTVLFFMHAPFAQSGAPDSFTAYQNAVYAETVSFSDLETLYTRVKQDTAAAGLLPETKLMFQGALEELRIRTQLNAGNKQEEALLSLETGIEYAEQSIKEKPTAQGYATLSSLYSAGIKIKPNTMLSMGIKIQNTTKKAIKLDPQNATAVHLQASGEIYGPAPFRNLKKGIDIAQKYLENPAQDATQADLFNLAGCIAHGYYLREDTTNADIWFNKAAALFPNNKIVTDRGAF